MAHPALVIGGDGTIGAALTAALTAAGEPVIATTRRPECVRADRPLLDLQAGNWAEALTSHYQSAYLCAALSRLQECHDHPARAALVNVERMIALAGWLGERRSFVVFPSSSQVFNGSIARVPAEHPVSPVTVYGQQKAAAETGILGLGYPAAVLRLSKVIHPGMPLFTGWIAALRAGQSITAFTDMAMAPIPLTLAITAMRALAASRHPGLFQLSASEDICYFDVACYIAKRLGVDAALVRPALASQLLAEPPPARTALDSRRLEVDCGITVPSPWASLDAVLDVEFDQ